MNPSEQDPISSLRSGVPYLDLPKAEAIQLMESLITRSQALHDGVVHSPPKTEAELIYLVEYRDGSFHTWLRGAELDLAKIFAPPCEPLTWFKTSPIHQWDRTIPWQKRAQALPEDIKVRLDLLEVILWRITNTYEEAPKAAQQTESAKLKRLRASMSSKFSMEELGVLCFDLDIPSENLPSMTVDGRVIDIINYQKRRDQLPALIERLKIVRPNQDWDL